MNKLNEHKLAETRVWLKQRENLLKAMEQFSNNPVPEFNEMTYKEKEKPNE